MKTKHSGKGLVPLIIEIKSGSLIITLLPQWRQAVFVLTIVLILNFFVLAVYTSYNNSLETELPEEARIIFFIFFVFGLLFFLMAISLFVNRTWLVFTPDTLTITTGPIGWSKRTINLRNISGFEIATDSEDESYDLNLLPRTFISIPILSDFENIEQLKNLKDHIEMFVFRSLGAVPSSKRKQ